MIRAAVLGAVGCLAAGFAYPVAAVERITLVTPLDTVDTVISEVIVREAYRRIGVEVDIQKYPAERALRLADQGLVDGEVQRIDGINSRYTNLIKVEPPINFIEATVFTKSMRFEVDGWDSLKPYSIGIILGIKFAERHTKGMNAVAVKDYPTLFTMLDKGRFDIATSPRVNGLYQMKRLGIEGIDELSPAVMRFELFHYLHKKHAALAAKIAVIFEEMRANGELARLRNHVIAVLLDLADKGLPLCDDDYACFETTAD